MKKLQCSWTVGAVSVLLMSSIALAQSSGRRSNENRSSTKGAHNPAGELGSPVFRASQLNGVKVKNRAGQEVGKIYDLVINTQSGNASYVALSVGGFLGIGDKLFAIPYDAFTFVPAEQSPTRDSKATQEGQRDQRDTAVTSTGKLNDVAAVLDISRETLQQAVGFDKHTWPNMIDPSWRTANDLTYQSLQRRKLNRSVEPTAAQVMRVSQLIGHNVVNANNETVGEIEDLMLDDSNGSVRYVALSVGGFLGIGSQLYAIPMPSFAIQNDADGKTTVELPVTKESFKGIEGFNKDRWPDLADKSWRERNDQSYQAWTRRSK